jgi:hypothetical protein
MSIALGASCWNTAKTRHHLMQCESRPAPASAHPANICGLPVSMFLLGNLLFSCLIYLFQHMLYVFNNRFHSAYIF